jgi:hypothetical protein
MSYDMPKRRTKGYQKSKLSGDVAKGFAAFVKKHKGSMVKPKKWGKGYGDLNYENPLTLDSNFNLTDASAE